MKTKAHAVTRGSSNIFADLGLPNADEHMLKARVVVFIGKKIEQLGLTQQAAGKRMGIKQPDVSNILRGRFDGFSLERLLGFVRSLGSLIATFCFVFKHQNGWRGISFSVL